MKILISCLIIWAFSISAIARTPFNGLLLTLDGEPIKNARVFVKSPKDYALTNKKGEFGLTDVAPTDTLNVLVKKQLYRIPVEGKRSMRIRLADEKNIRAEEDQQLVDIGFSYVPRRERTTPGNFISGDELRRSGRNDVLAALQGRVPGLNISINNGFPGDETVSMRGTRTLKGNSTPLFFIDTMRVPSFEGLSIYDIDYVEIMKDASVYGSEGANGAIIVHTYLTK
ncbi:MAG: TonB-dependent receptor plug domain-containing protein [Bacteroides sp.]|nr:TonB-dependent receptor plug domain-containing protein [Bacteroides sp.]